MNNVYIIIGQTATGKTKYAYELAKKLDGELINFDSRQIYKKLDIITGKERFDDVKTYLIDIIDPKEYFSSYDFCLYAQKALKQVLTHQKTPIFVGGTYLYIKHLLYGAETNNIPPDWELRSKLEKLSINRLQERLRSLNPLAISQMNKSDKNNPRRLIRKLEIEHFYTKNRKGIDGWQKRMGSHKHGATTYFGASICGNEFFDRTHQGKENNLNIKIIGLKFKHKESLKNAIKKRVEQRLRNGAIEEVKKLLKSGYSDRDPGLQTIGYKQIIQFLSEQLTKEQTIEQWINKELQYAKRQYTFMKKDKKIRWIEV
jgi:tRNA dimethylallyltransferase